MCDSVFSALSPEGDCLWTAKVGARNGTMAIGKDGTIYIGGGYRPEYLVQHDFVALNADGSILFSLPIENTSHSSPAIDASGTIYIGSGKYLLAIGD